MKRVLLPRLLAVSTLASALVVVIASVLLSACQKHAPASGAPVGSVISERYRNLFAEAGYSTDGIDQKVEHAFAQLFYGDPETEAVYYRAGDNERGPLAYILDVYSQDVRSEGLSYGMMIAVQMNKKAEFDAIWNWAMTYMYQSDPAHPTYGYFAWSVKPTGEAIDEMPAPDGEQYFITALYFASERWGDGANLYHYSSQAHRLLEHVLHREEIQGPTNRGEKTAGALFDRAQRMVRFTPDSEFTRQTDPSYHLPAFYEVWGRVGPAADRAFWLEAAEVSRDYLYRAAHPVTGLTPDYGNFDGTPWAAPWRPESVDFRYDAWRTAMNWSMDWAWWANDPRQVELSNRLLAFFQSQGIDRYSGLYTLAGKPLDQQQPAALVAMNATAALAADSPAAERFVHALWYQGTPRGQYRYYDGMLHLMALLHVSGQYRAWVPREALPVP